MSDSSLRRERVPPPLVEPPQAPRRGFFRDQVLRVLAGLRHGRLEIVEGGGSVAVGRADAEVPLRATVVVHDPRFWRAIALGGAGGPGQASLPGPRACGRP